MAIKRSRGFAGPSGDQFPYFFFEPLEPRVFLSADVTSTAAPSIVFSQPPGQDVGAEVYATAGQSFTGKIGTIYIAGDANGAIAPVGDTFYLASSNSDPTCSVVGINVTWGDGAESEGTGVTLVANSSGGWDVYGTHTFATPGDYRIAITESHSAGYNPNYNGPPVAVVLPMWMSIQTDATSIAVVGAAASPGTPTSNQTFNGVLDSVPYNPGSGLADGYVVPYGNNGANGFNYVNIDWGDGTTSGAQLVANNLGDLDVTGSHAYAAIGFYNVTVTGQSYFSAPALDYNGGGNTGKLNFVVTVVVTSSSVYIQNPPLPDQTVYPAVVPTAAAASSPQIAAVNVSAKSTPSLFSVTPIGVAVDGLFNSDAGSSPLDNSGM